MYNNVYIYIYMCVPSMMHGLFGTCVRFVGSLPLLVLSSCLALSARLQALPQAEFLRNAKRGEIPGWLDSFVRVPRGSPRIVGLLCFCVPGLLFCFFWPQSLMSSVPRSSRRPRCELRRWQCVVVLVDFLCLGLLFVDGVVVCLCVALRRRQWHRRCRPQAGAAGRSACLARFPSCMCIYICIRMCVYI